MAESNGQAIDIDSAEHIRKITAMIRKTSGNPAFPSTPGSVRAPSNITHTPDAAPPGAPTGHRKSTDAPSAPITATASPANGTPSSVGHAADEGDRALASAALATPSPADTDSTDLPHHPMFDYGNRLNQLPRAVQNIIGESPQLSGVRAPHSTPVSFKPSPMTEVQHLEDPPSNEEIGMAIGHVLDSLPNAGKYGIEDSMWAPRGPRARMTYPPKASITDGQLLGHYAMQDKKTEKEIADARAREKEHNETFERMSFKIADSPWWGKKYTGRFTTQEEKPKSVSEPQQIAGLSEATSKGKDETNQLSENLANDDDSESDKALLDREYNGDLWAPTKITHKSIFTPESSFTAKDHTKAVSSPLTKSKIPTATYQSRSIGTQYCEDDFIKVAQAAVSEQQAERRRSSDAWVKVKAPSDVAVEQVVPKATTTQQPEPEGARQDLTNSLTEDSPAPYPNPPKVAEPTKKPPSINSVLAAGRSFAKSRQSVYGAPKIEASAANEAQELSPSGQPKSSLTPGSMEFVLASPASVAAAAIGSARMATQEEAAGEDNREHALYFKAWGKPEDRLGAPSEQRKLILYGIPAWDLAPTPSFIASLVFGGPLELIRCMEHTAEVTFLSGTDAKKFYDATPNDILYRKDASGPQYASVKWVEDVTPMSSLVEQHIENGVTRCVHAIGILDYTIERLKFEAGGRVDRRGNPMRKVESVEKGISARGHRFAIFRFCDIRDAATFKTEKARDVEWEAVNMQFVADPCAEAKGPRVKSSATAL